MKHNFKSLVAIVLSCSMILSVTDNIPKTAKAASTYKLNNPTMDSNGVSTWDCIWFGNYWQNDTNGDGVADKNDEKQPIKWRVLSVNGDDAFVLADQNLDAKQYNETNTDITWENCTMRSWLNGYGASANKNEKDFTDDNFINNAFSAAEQEAIQTTGVVNEDNPYYETDGGNNTEDKVYLLAISEASNALYGFNSKYNTNSKTRETKNTEYTKKSDAYTYTIDSSYSGNGYWWLRTPGGACCSASSVCYDGHGYSDYFIVNDTGVAVRPAFHINLSSSNLWSYAGTVCSDGTVDEVKYDESQKDNSSIIEAVKKYSTDNETFKKMLLAISEKDLPNDVKMQLMSSVCTQYGFDNVKEGIEYVQDASSAQRAYQTLINNEQYGSWQFGNYLNNTTKGKVARGLLYADGMIFNGELKSWMDPGTYVENDYPGIKKYKTLLTSFIGKKSDEFAVCSNVDSIIKNYNNMVKIKEIDDDVLLEKIMDAKTDKEKDELIKKLFAKEKLKLNNDGKTVTLSSDKFAKMFKIASASFTFGSDAIEDMVAFFHTEEKIGLYQKYNQFFEEIIKAEDLPFELRAAAYSLEQEMESGYWEPFKKLILHGLKNADALQTAVGGEIKVEKGEFDNLLGEATETIELAAFCVNLLVDMGGVVKNAAYTNGYAFLTAHYANLLEESRVRFSSEQTEENAWDFYNKYNMLYCLRIEGEKTYLDLNSLSPDGISGWGGYLLKYAFNYEGKRELVEHNINYLEQYCKFELPSGVEVPEYCQYSQKAVLKCPVDVEVTDSSGNTVAYIKDGEESDVTNTYGRFISQYKPYTKDYTKIIYLKDAEKYEYKIIGQGDGDVSLEMYGQNNIITCFSNIQIQKNDVIVVDNQESATCTIDRGNDGTIDETYELEKKTDDKLILLQSLNLSNESLELEEGESYKLSCSIEPSNAVNNHVSWNSLNNNIATVSDDGEIKAHKSGKTDIYCVSTSVDEDGSLLMKKCTITVKSVQATEKPSETASPVPSASVTSTPGNSSNPMPTETSAPTVTPSPEVTNIPDSGQISTPTQKPSETTTIPDVSDTSIPNTPSVPITSETPTPGTTVSAQPDFTPMQKPSETTTVPSASATIEPGVVPTLQPSETASSTPTATVTATPKSDIIDSDDSNKNQTVAKGCTFIGSNGTALYKITKTGKSNTVSYVRNLKKSRKTVKIPSVVKYKGITYKVTAIGKKAFYKNIKLKKVVFGKNITNVDANAFYKCNKLKTLKLNEKLSKIGDNAFAKCIKLQYIVIPKGVRKIGKRAFYGCKNLKYILIKSNQLTKKQIGKDSFAKGYKKVRVKTSKKKRKLYSRNMIHKGKMSSKAIFVAGKIPLVVKK